jgi:hypothetical protein
MAEKRSREEIKREKEVCGLVKNTVFSIDRLV